MTLLYMYPGIAAGSGGSGFEMDQEDAVTLVQLVVSKCLDREILCNELYLQLIKQTTDQPGAPYWGLKVCKNTMYAKML